MYPCNADAACSDTVCTCIARETLRECQVELTGQNMKMESGPNWYLVILTAVEEVQNRFSVPARESKA